MISDIQIVDFFDIQTRRKIKASCYLGHEYTPDNTGVGSRGGRYCRCCARINGRNRLRKFRIREALAYSVKP